MSQQQSQEEILNTQLNVEKDQNKENSHLVEIENVPNTPFRVAKHNEKWYVIMGKKAVSHDYTTKDEAIESIESDRWFTILVMIHIAVEMILEEKSKPKNSL